MADVSKLPFTVSLTPEKKIELASLFQIYDKDQNGRLDKKEFAEYCKRVFQAPEPVSVDHKHLFKIIDADGNGTVSFDEFMAFNESMIQLKEKGDVKKYYKMVYDLCDKGKKGYLTPKEFTKFLKYTGTKVGMFEGKKQMKKFDMDGDGKIEWEEITTALLIKSMQEESQAATGDGVSQSLLQ